MHTVIARPQAKRDQMIIDFNPLIAGAERPQVLFTFACIATRLRWVFDFERARK